MKAITSVLNNKQDDTENRRCNFFIGYFARSTISKLFVNDDKLIAVIWRPSFSCSVHVTTSDEREWSWRVTKIRSYMRKWRESILTYSVVLFLYWFWVWEIFCPKNVTKWAQKLYTLRLLLLLNSSYFAKYH